MAALALTIARIGPVAPALIGTGIRWPTVAYIGWFGPRGFATVVSSVLVLDNASLPGTDTIIVIAATTVFMSVYAHGLTASTGASRYAVSAEEESGTGDLVEATPLKQTVSRGRFREPRDIQGVSDNRWVQVMTVWSTTAAQEVRAPRYVRSSRSPAGSRW